ncbi:exonuclease SbcC [Larkinella arboricola]|uniref:Exonuclease SbcC n=1 Tax=Larkinella arboricola TaxID=643671 RepID=A0A327WX48_LARAB|nr:AAA family ATPase [Larkinella arboricola]RAJ97877.1 exonuclease SbcC [Larkinella arboricola]
MKIRQIRFRNINSFYGEHPPIQFNEGLLSTTGLFVISGPTGAGKSTLLDVITLALFNRVPRISGAISNSSIIEEGILVNQQAALEPGTAAYAEIEYEVGGKAYRSRWSIKKNRNGNWNNYEMEIAFLPEGQTEGQLLPIKGLSEFPKKNEELIGLTYDQFIRSIVLAQGAFDQFLKARAAERSKMLERITGTEIYRQLSQRAHQVNREYELKIADKQKEGRLIQTLTEEEVEQLKQEQKAVERRLKEVSNEIELYAAEDALLRRMAEAESQLAVLNQREQLLETKQNAFADEAKRLHRHELVADLATDLVDLTHIEKNREREAVNQRAAQAQLATLNQQLAELVGKAQILTHQPTLTAQTLVEEVDHFRSRVLEVTQQINTERDKVRQPLELIKETVKDAKHGWLRALDTRNIDETYQQVKEKKQEIGVHLVQLERDYPALTLETVRSEINRLIEQNNHLTGLYTILKQQQDRLLDGMNLNDRITSQLELIRNQEPLRQQMADELGELEGKKKQLDEQKVRLSQEANLEELRKALQDGKPCPLCGSVEHPYAQHYINQMGTLELQLQWVTRDWEAKKKEYDELNKKLIQAESDCASYTQQRDELRKLYSQKRTEISQNLTALALDASLTPEQILDQQELNRIQREELSTLQSLWEQEDTLKRLETDLQTVLESTAKGQQLKREKEKLYAGDDIREVCERLTGQFGRLNTQIATQTDLLTNAVTAFTAFDQQYTASANTLQPALEERGLNDVDSARAWLLDPATLRRLQDQKKELENEANEIRRKRQEESSKRQEAVQNRKTEDSAEEIAEKLKALKTEERQKIERVGYFKNQIDSDRDSRKIQKKLASELTRLEADARPWRELDRLIGSAKGDDYSKFAQGLTLAQLIGLANRRLKDLSDRYLLLKPRDGQDELYVVDLYQGSTERTVSSLSGGETFTLSLALALGLSDLASQNVQIESLFIDEGFGTLDPDALDTAIAMLEKLQHDSKKTIGIISHRHEIKERISVQIQVEKGMEGNSKIKVLEL